MDADPHETAAMTDAAGFGAAHAGRRLRHFLLLVPLFFCVSCSDETLSLFFDIPPPTPEEIAAERAEEAARAAAERRAEEGAEAGLEAEPRKELEIETIETWDEAKRMLPKDQKGRRGRPNLEEAIRQGIIDPRDAIDGAPRREQPTFKYDFYFPAPPDEPEFMTYFPHSTHTEWVACESCHPKIFPLRINKFTKRDLKKGKYCGVCHRLRDHEATAFWLKSCVRCHPFWTEEEEDDKKKKKKKTKKSKKKSKKSDKKKAKKKAAKADDEKKVTKKAKKAKKADDEEEDEEEPDEEEDEEEPDDEEEADEDEGDEDEEDEG